MKPNGDNICVEVKRILDEDGNEQESAPHPKQVLYVDLGMPLEQYDILRRQEQKKRRSTQKKRVQRKNYRQNDPD